MNIEGLRPRRGSRTETHKLTFKIDPSKSTKENIELLKATLAGKKRPTDTSPDELDALIDGAECHEHEMDADLAGQPPKPKAKRVAKKTNRPAGKTKKRK